MCTGLTFASGPPAVMTARSRKNGPIYLNSIIMRRLSILALLPALLWACSGEPRYTDPQLPVEKRVEDLLFRMSLEEKVAQASAQLLFMDEF